MRRLLFSLIIILTLTGCTLAVPSPTPTAVPPTVTLTPESTSTPAPEPTRAVEVIGASAVSFDVAEDGFITPPQGRDHYVEVVTLPAGTDVEGAVLTDSLGNVIRASHSDETSGGAVRLLFSVPRGQTGGMTVTLADGSVARVNPPETEPENAV